MGYLLNNRAELLMNTNSDPTWIKAPKSGVSHDGTGLQGYLPEGTRYEDIVRVFGEPQFGKSPDGKIKVEWVGQITVWCLQFTITNLDLNRNKIPTGISVERLSLRQTL